MAHVAEWKYKEVEEIAELMRKYPVVGIASIYKIPAPQMQKIRRELKDHLLIRVVKNNLIRLAIEKVAEEKKDIKKLEDLIDGPTAIIASDLNPFKLYKIVMEKKTPMPAKGGDIAPHDIVVKEGPTPFKPGPIVGDFQRAGIPAAIDKGKIVIRKTKTVVKEGEVISPELALALTKLEIYPFEVGLDIRGLWEDGTVFTPENLTIDIDKIRGDFTAAAQHAVNLSLEIGYTTPLTVPLLLAKAHRDALAVALSAAVLEKDILPILLGKAHSQMLSLASRLSDGLDEELKEVLGSAPAPAAPEEHQGGGEEKKVEKKEEKEEEEPSEEEALSGLGALFG
ncbi:MAG: 50S ribosomal protein L10 [Thermoprotei archaeon]|nr:MAG: 50S ribosomal protein L10 [Thermoprotei archaeon]